MSVHSRISTGLCCPGSNSSDSESGVGSVAQLVERLAPMHEVLSLIPQYYMSGGNGNAGELDVILSYMGSFRLAWDT